MSFLRRIRGLFWEEGTPPADGEPGPGPDELVEPSPEPDDDDEARLLPPEPPPPAEAGPGPEERELRRLIHALQVAPASARPPVDTRRVDELIGFLVADGWTRVAVDLLRELTGLAPHLDGLRLRLAELLYDLGEPDEALPLLRELAETPGQRLRAHFLLGEHHGREDDAVRALQHYEVVLALDFRHPRARGRAEELRRRLDRPVATAAPTIFGAEDLGPGGRFLLQRELGRGGGGTVYLAVDQTLSRPVAVKVLHPHVAQRQEARVHLFGEARIAAALRHPRIVTIYDLEESLNLVVMEYCAGGALAGRIAAEGPQPPADALQRLAEITAVLDTVHRCGVIHRDLKPGNLLLRTDAPDAPLVLTDFGAAHAGGHTEEPDAAAAGSLIYMAPEQRRGAALDPRADLYACGVILLEMLLGRPPLGQQQAIAGDEIVGLGEVWRELEDRLPRAEGRAMSAFCRGLVSPDVGARPGQGEEVTRLALDLARRLQDAEIGRDVLQELRRRGAARPGPDVELWLAEAERDLSL